MTIFLLAIASILLSILALKMAHGDYFEPAVCFCLLFAGVSVICLLNTDRYQLQFSVESCLLILMGMLAFCAASRMSRAFGRIRRRRSSDLPADPPVRPVRFPTSLKVLMILFQLGCIYFMLQYLRSLSIAFYGSAGNLNSQIHLYNLLTNFWTDAYANLGVPIPLFHRIFNPICHAAEALTIYLFVNRWVTEKKIDPLYTIIIVLDLVRILLDSSRSPVFRMVTQFLILFYIMGIQQKRFRRGSRRILAYCILTALLIVGLAVASLGILGRSLNGAKVWDYIFVYTGAPLVNFNSITQNGLTLVGNPGQPFGWNTFHGLYTYYYKLIHSSVYNEMRLAGAYFTSSTGQDLGNVATYLPTVLADFGVLGLFPAVFLMGCYYCGTYRAIFSKPSRRALDFRLFLYSYLFNDLVMQFFSARFSEMVFSAEFIKMILIAYMIDLLIIEPYNRQGTEKCRLVCRRIKNGGKVLSDRGCAEG